MPALAPRRLGSGREGFAALLLPEPLPGVDALAADCVRLLEDWRAPLDAATLALHYSKMRSAKAADVSYTPRKYVSKPRGANGRSRDSRTGSACSA